MSTRIFKSTKKKHSKKSSKKSSKRSLKKNKNVQKKLRLVLQKMMRPEPPNTFFNEPVRNARTNLVRTVLRTPYVHPNQDTNIVLLKRIQHFVENLIEETESKYPGVFIFEEPYKLSVRLLKLFNEKWNKTPSNVDKNTFDYLFFHAIEIAFDYFQQNGNLSEETINVIGDIDDHFTPEELYNKYSSSIHIKWQLFQQIITDSLESDVGDVVYDRNVPLPTTHRNPDAYPYDY